MHIDANEIRASSVYAIDGHNLIREHSEREKDGQTFAAS
jgi:hypothetical protein